MDDAEVLPSQSAEQTRKDRCKAFLTSNRFLIYVCCFISSWGDRMWRFAIGVYMIALYPISLELTATYGFVHSGCSLLFGAVIGDMIDRSQRLRAVRVSLLVRNFSIFSCSAYVFVIFTFWERVKGTMLLEVSKGVIIMLAVVAHLASIANNISVTKDWAVVVCGSNKQILMEMSANFRRIDLVCKILSPIVLGQIMSFVSNTASAIFICCENIVTLIVMYGILTIVYRRVPRLAVKEDASNDQRRSAERNESSRERRRKHCLGRMCFTCISFVKGWSCYVRQPVAAAGFSLAMMYMTVLGFDNITVGYAYSQGLSPSILGWIMACTAITGIIGTFIFQPLRKCFGLIRSGIIAYILDLVCLQMCVWSVFAPGTAFLKWPTANQTGIASGNSSGSIVPTTVVFLNNSDHLSLSKNISSNSSGTGTGANSFQGVNPSLALLMTGIVSSRIGLWLIDLVVTQLILETVSEKKRGKVNGVQYSLNMFLDLLKFLLVIFIPQPAYFGFLIITSFTFIVLSFVTFLGFGCWNHCIDPSSLNTENDAQPETKALAEEDVGDERVTASGIDS